MKKALFALVFLILGCAQVFAQAPNQINYQGVARSATGLPLASTAIGMRLSVHDGSASGTVVYQETHVATTNTFGLYNVAIGGGTVVIGSFGSINWGSGSKYLQVELDPTGGTSYTTVGTNELLSVPYSIYSNFSGNVSGTTNRISRFSSANTIGNSLLTDSSMGLMYNTSLLLAPTSMKLVYQAPSIGSSTNWFSFLGDNNSYSFLTVSDSGTGNRGIVFTSSQNLASGFTTDLKTAILLHNPSTNQFYLTNSASTWLTVDMSSGSFNVTGMLSKGGGTFKIDHPQDPENKYLYHSFVESPDMMDVYNGNITTGADGIAIVELPSYFEALNKDFRYQLTVIGTFAQAIVGQKVQDNKFVIKTSLPNVEVSWQVTGVRNDKFAQAHRVVPEVEKEETNKGKYLHPVEYGKPVEQGIGHGVNANKK